MFLKSCSICLLVAVPLVWGSSAGERRVAVEPDGGFGGKRVVRRVLGPKGGDINAELSESLQNASIRSAYALKYDLKCSGGSDCPEHAYPLMVEWEENTPFPVVGRKTGIPGGWKRVAVLFSGHHYKISGPPWPPQSVKFDNSTKTYHSKTKSTDWRSTRDTWRRNMFDVLAKNGIEVDVYMHTWPSHPHLERELLADFKPKRWVIENQSSCLSGADSKLKAMQLVSEGQEKYDAIITTRFELQLSQPLDTFSIDPEKLNVGYRFYRYCQTDDLMYILPQHMLFLNWQRVGPGLIANLPKELSSGKVDEHGCHTDWSNHVHFMSKEFGLSGERNPLGVLSRDLVTVEDGPYYVVGKKEARPQHQGGTCVFEGRKLA